MRREQRSLVHDFGLEDAPRLRCTMRGCRKVLTVVEAQVMVCNEHALRIWGFIQRRNHDPDFIDAAVAHYEKKLKAELMADRGKRIRINPTKADMRKFMDEVLTVTPPREPDPQWDDWVEEDIYYIKQGDLIKIGYSTDLESRLKSYGPTITVLAHHQGTRADERDLHRTFRPFLAHGREWYNPSQILLDHIAEVVERCGEPFCIPEWSKPRGPVTASRRSSQPKPTGIG